MEPPHGGAPAEDAAYRAGMVHARLGALELHAATVNGAIKTTGEALAALTLSVNELRLTIKMLEIADLNQRVAAIEQQESSAKSVERYRRWLIGTSLAALAVGTGIAANVLHLF